MLIYMLAEQFLIANCIIYKPLVLFPRQSKVAKNRSLKENFFIAQRQPFIKQKNTRP